MPESSTPISPMSDERLFAIEETARNHSGPVSRLIYHSDVTTLVGEVRRLRELIPSLVDTARDWGYYPDGSTEEVAALQTVIELLDKAGVHMLGVNDPESAVD